MRPFVAVAAVLLPLVLSGCPPPRASDPSRAAQGPTVPAKVLTIHTTTLPEKKALRHKVVIADRKVRLGNEVDEWRLFDLEARTVTFVDDIARTYRTVPLDRLVRERRAQMSGGAPILLRDAVLTRTRAARSFAEVPAHQYVIRLGTWRREVWLSDEPIAGEGFFPMLVASEPLGAPYASIMESVQREMMSLEGFPVFERSDLHFGDQHWIIEKKLVRIDRMRMPQALLTIPAGYTDLNAPKSGESPGGRRPSVSSPPNRTTRAAE